MEAKDIITIVIAVVALFISLLAYNQGSERTVLRREQRSKLRILGVRTLTLFEQVKTFVVAPINHYQVDPYMFPSAQGNAKALVAILDDCLGLGMLNQVAGPDKHAVLRYIAFVSALADIGGATPDECTDLRRWGSQHLVMGLVRTLDRCLEFKPSLFPANVAQEIRASIGGLAEESYTYLEINTREGEASSVQSTLDGSLHPPDSAS